MNTTEEIIKEGSEKVYQYIGSECNNRSEYIN